MRRLVSSESYQIISGKVQYSTVHTAQSSTPVQYTRVRSTVLYVQASTESYQYCPPPKPRYSLQKDNSPVKGQRLSSAQHSTNKRQPCSELTRSVCPSPSLVAKSQVERIFVPKVGGLSFLRTATVSSSAAINRLPDISLFLVHVVDVCIGASPFFDLENHVEKVPKILGWLSPATFVMKQGN